MRWHMRGGKHRKHQQRLHIALVGNPNVGKSCLFNHLTGMGVDVANYPGTTVELYRGRTRCGDVHIDIVDLPGAYATSNHSIEASVVRDYLSNDRPDVVINVVDANLLDRNLYLTLQLLEMGLPTVIALNFYEECRDCGIEIDTAGLSRELGVPVIEIDALRGAGISELMEAAIAVAENRPTPRRLSYDDHIEDAIAGISKIIHFRTSMPKRYFSILLLQDDKHAWRILDSNCPRCGDEARRIIRKKSKHYDLPTEVARERHSQAAVIARAVKREKKPDYSNSERLDRITTEPLSGTVVMLLVLFTLFSSLFFFGGFLEGVIVNAFEGFVAPVLQPAIQSVQNLALQKTLEYSLIWGLEAGLSIAIPYILVFYFILAFLEDTGYLPRMSYLLDRIMHKIGLHGKAIVPMMLGFGCSVPAIISTRLLQNQRERLITATLVSLIPCSARTAIILGAVGFYLGWSYALSIYAILLGIILAVGFFLGRYLPGEPEGLIMEMPKYRMPSLISLMKKTWIRMKGFIYIAFPLLVIGSGILGLLEGLGVLRAITAPFSPLVSGWLMLPSVTGVALIYGVLRKEMALETILVLAGTANLLTFMTPLQIYIFALVSSIYIPCIATIGVLVREFGWRRSVMISTVTVLIAFLAGGTVARVFPMLGLLV